MRFSQQNAREGHPQTELKHVNMPHKGEVIDLDAFLSSFHLFLNWSQTKYIYALIPMIKTGIKMTCFVAAPDQGNANSIQSVALKITFHKNKE